MNKAVPWSIKGVDFDARTAAKEAARRAGMSLGDWLNNVIAERAAEQGVDPEDIGDEERVAAVTSHLENMSRGAKSRRRSDRPAMSRLRGEDDDAGADDDYTPARPGRSAGAFRETAYARPMRPERGYEFEPDYGPRLSGFSAENMLDEAVSAFERRTRRDNAQTNAALSSVARRLESIESRLDDQRGEPAFDPNLRRVISKLENRIEALVAREDSGAADRRSGAIAAPDPSANVRQLQNLVADTASAGSAPAQPQAMRSADLARIEAKLNRILERADQPAPRYESAPPSQRNLQDAVAEIHRRQAELDRDFGGSASASTMERAAPAMARRTRAFSSAMPPQMPQQRPQPPASEYQGELRNTVTALKSEISNLAQQLKTVKLEADSNELKEQRAALNRVAAVAPAIDDLRSQIGDMRAYIGRLAQQDGYTSLEAAIRDLDEHVRQSRRDGLRESIVQPVAQLVEDMKRALAEQSPNAAVHAIEHEIAAIHRNIEALGHSGIDQDAFARVCEQTSEIRNLLAAAVSRSASSENLEKQIAGLARRVDLIASRGPTAAGASAVHESVDAIRAAFEEAAPTSLLASIEGRFEELSRKIDMAVSASANVSPQFDRKLDELARKIDSTVANSIRVIPGVEQKLEELSRRIQASSSAAPQSLPHIEKKLDDLARRFGAAAGAGQPVPLYDHRFDELARKIDDTVAGLPRSLPHIERKLEELARALETQGGREAPAAPQIDLISRQLDSMQKTLAWQSERPPVTKVDTSVLEAMLQQVIDRVSAPPSNGDTQAEIGKLEKTVRDLAARIDEISQQGEFAGLAGIEERLVTIADKFELPSASQPLDTVERTLNQLSMQLEENRLAAIDAASNAARSAVRDVLDELRGNGASSSPVAFDEARDLIAREINGLRSLQDASDRRTHATLGAVHETLEKVVDRLAMLETEIAEAERAEQAGPAAQRPLSGVEEDAPYASGPPPVFSRADAAPKSSALTLEPELDADQRNRDHLHGGSATQNGAPATPAPAQAAGQKHFLHSLEDDFLIEPGSGIKPVNPAGPAAPDLRNAPPEAAKATPEFQSELAEIERDQQTGRNSASNFIAAARRAQQAAQAKADAQAAQEQQSSRRNKGNDGPEGTFAEARARAKAAAAKLSGVVSKKEARKEAKIAANAAPAALSGDEAEAAGRWNRARGLLGSRKVLFSLAGLVLILGALTIVRQNINKPAKPRAVTSAPAVSGATATTQAPAIASPLSGTPDKLSNTATNRFERTGNVPATAMLQPPEPTDRSPVSSINPEEPASENRANNLRLAAASGNPAAQYEMAIRISEGRGEPRDMNLAAQWLQKAAVKDLPPAQYRLASLYEKGIGVAKDTAQARRWYEKAASAGNVKAMHNLAVLLAEGGDGKPDYATAANWFKKAAEHGVRDSQYNLAILYARGLGTPQSMIDSYLWFALAARQGDTDAEAKRSDVAKRLSPGQLAEANSRLGRFRVQKANLAANEVATPPGGWKVEAAAPMLAPPAAAPSLTIEEPASTAPARGKRPKVSSL